jgi:hypothetical protein
MAQMSGVDGGVLWQTRFRASDGGRATGAILAAGVIVLSGEFEGVLSSASSSTTSNGGRDIFLAHVSPDSGRTLHMRSFGGHRDERIVALGGADPNLYVSWYSNSAAYGAPPKGIPFVGRLDPRNLVLRWFTAVNARAAGSAPWAIETSGSGDAMLVGTATGTVRIGAQNSGGHPFRASGFVASLSACGGKSAIQPRGLSVMP